MSGMSDSTYLKFPFTVGGDGPRTSSRSAHVREQIEQVLFTSPKERVFRPEFGIGVRRLVFEPNNSVLWNITHKQLSAALSSALQGEVDPKTLEIKIDHEDNKLVILISYMLAAINRRESQTFAVAGPGNG
jgi:uncharacterized protein